MPREFFTAERHLRRDEKLESGRNWDVEMMQVMKTLNRLEEKVEKLSIALPDPAQLTPNPNDNHCLEKSRQELIEIYNPPPDKRLDSAAEELVAVIQATECATEEILSACEIIDAISQNISGKHTGILVMNADDLISIQECVIRIYQAATFQDITGQRITKVSRILGHIEERITKLADVMGMAGDDLLQVAKVAEQTADVLDEKSLLNGPARAGEGISQSDIDAMFN